MRDPYRILQVAPHAEIEVIEAAYRRLARKYHPDVDPSTSATQRMQEINWAYEVLRDPLKRAQYDRSAKEPFNAHPGPQEPSPQPSAEARRPASRPKQAASNEATAPRVRPTPSKPSFIRRNWIWIVLVLGTLYLMYRPQPTEDLELSENAVAQSSSNQPDPFEECIYWTQAALFDGERKCVIGRIVIVTDEFDPLSGADVWTAHFSFNDTADFRLISVDRDISRWEGQCVVAYGTLSDRDAIRDYVDDPQPSMVDSDPFDHRGFSLRAAPSSKCR